MHDTYSNRDYNIFNLVWEKTCILQPTSTLSYNIIKLTFPY